MIGIINYKAGNSHSVVNACKKIEIDCKYISTAEDFTDVSAIILPGVGSAKATMNSLQELNIISKLEEYVLGKKIPFLGICVGLQVLFEHSEEDDTDCLGWIKGNVVKYNNNKVRVPQIGWNKLSKTKDDEFFNGLGDDEYFYFVNSYYAKPSNEDDLLAISNYNGDFCAMIKHENIYACQCHIEKSGSVGLKVLKNFCKEVANNVSK